MSDISDALYDKLDIFEKLQEEIQEVKTFYHDFKSVGEITEFLNSQDISSEIHSEQKKLIIELLQQTIAKVHLLGDIEENSRANQVLRIYLDAFAQICMFMLIESSAEENLRHQNHQSVIHFAKVYENEIEKLNDKLQELQIQVDSKTETKLKSINETRQKLEKAEASFETNLQDISQEYAQKNEQNIEKYLEIIRGMEQSKEIGDQEVANNSKMWMNEVHKLAAQRLKVEQAYQMILRQFDTEIGGKADKLDELQNELSEKTEEHEKWRAEVFEPMKIQYDEMIAERKEILLMKMSARKIQKWWRKILKKRRKKAKQLARLEKLQQGKNGNKNVGKTGKLNSKK